MPRTHKTLPRLYLDIPLEAGGEIALAKEQAHYLVNVLRRSAGDRCVIFNGRDGAFLAEITQSGKKAFGLLVVEQSAPQSPASDLWFGFAPIKRLDYVVQKATEMGAGVIQPVITRFVQSPRVNMDKLRANAIEAAEQCEVLNVPRTDEPIVFDSLLSSWTETHGDRLLVFADEEADAASPVDILRAADGRRLGLMVGPEGGFSPEERAALRAKDFVLPISLGPRILRADTAAVAALAIIQASAGDW